MSAGMLPLASLKVLQIWSQTLKILPRAWHRHVSDRINYTQEHYIRLLYIITLQA